MSQAGVRVEVRVDFRARVRAEVTVDIRA